MNTTARYAILVLFVIIGLHSILTFTHEDYGNATSFSTLKTKWAGFGSNSTPSTLNSTVSGTHPSPVGSSGDPDDLDDLESSLPSNVKLSRPASLLNGRRANATLLMLARNSDLDNAVRSVRRLEDRFNRHFHYPWLFLNDQPFEERFKERIRVLTSGETTFAEVPSEHWNQPDDIDEEKAKAERQKMMDENVIYGGSVSYRNMCRFNSGFFFRNPALQKYRWYWRVEPDVHYHCDIEFDPFLYMEDTNKTYGFTIALYEYRRTIETLWPTVQEFTKLYPEFVAPNNAMGFLSDNGGQEYNLCHFWSNFEIADMDFWRGEAYTKFFEFLDSKGGFYYERWGDAPVHSIAAALFLPKERIHFFDEVGYEHNPYSHCPRGDKAWERGKCSCDQKKSFDYDGYSCMKKWDALVGKN